MAAREPYSPEEMASVFEKVLTDGRDKAYFYAPYQGNLELRKEITSFLASKGIAAAPGNLQIFSENNQTLDFLLSLMLSPGDKVIAAESLSPDVYRTIQMAGGEIIPVPMDSCGMICDELETVIQKQNPQFIYVDSSFHNPTGAMLSVERREKLLYLSYKYRIPIIEEDQGSDLYYESGEVPSIKSMDTGNNVIYMYSCSLTMMPGIGISFVLADRDVIQRLSKMVSMRMTSLDWAPQMLLLEYMKTGVYKERLEEFRRICRRKRDLMYSYIEKLSEDMELVCNKPDGGVFLWVKLPDGMDGKMLLKEVEKCGVIFIPGYVFCLKKGMGKNYIRLNYSYPSQEEIARGMEILGRSMRNMNQKIQIKDGADA
jgi:DNA-binding transcriptional MocR family regulator